MTPLDIICFKSKRKSISSLGSPHSSRAKQKTFTDTLHLPGPFLRALSPSRFASRLKANQVPRCIRIILPWLLTLDAEGTREA